MKHAHRYKFESNEQNCHKHRLLGFTDYSIGFSFFHVHYFSSICSYDNHTHYYSGFTGLPIKTKNGHLHKMETVLEYNNNHEHMCINYTQENIEYNGRPMGSKLMTDTK